MKTVLKAFGVFILFLISLRVWNTFDPYAGFALLGATIYLTYLLIFKSKKNQKNEKI